MFRLFRFLFKNVTSALGDGISNWFKRKTGSGMSDADKEAASLSLRNQQLLNEEEYERKIDFYERFESPAAQVRQHIDAGLNPMLLADGGASVSASGGIGSAGSAPAQASLDGGSILVPLLSALLGFKTRMAEVDVERTRNQILADQSPSVIYRNYGAGESSYATAEEKRALVDYKAAQLQAQTDVYREELSNKQVERELMRANISKSEAEAALTLREEALKAQQEKYGNKYWENVVELQELEKDYRNSQTSRNRVEMRFLEQQIENLRTENDNMLKEGLGIVMDNGIKAHEFDIIGKEAANADRRIKQENAARVIGMVTDCVDSAVGVVGAASGVGSAAAALRTAGASVSRADTYKRQTDYNVSRPSYRSRTR